MEASVAADGAAEGTQGTQETSSGGLDLTPIMGRFDELAPRLEQLETNVSQLLGTGEDTDDDPDAGFDFESLYGEPEVEPEPAAARELNPQALQALVQQSIEAQLGPVAQQVRELQVGLDAEALVARYPELGQENVAKPVVEAARALATQLGNPALADNTQFIEAIYKSQKADKYAAGEIPVGAEKGFELERASGAGPSQSGEQPNYVERLQQRQQAAPWPPRF
jgi:hypothetical protein